MTQKSPDSTEYPDHGKCLLFLETLDVDILRDLPVAQPQVVRCSRPTACERVRRPAPAATPAYGTTSHRGQGPRAFDKPRGPYTPGSRSMRPIRQTPQAVVAIL